MSAGKLKQTLALDLRAGLAVMFVAIPLAIGVAVSCDVPPMYGIISAVIGGVLVGALSGSPLQVSGPAAGLIVVSAHLVHEFGLEGLALATLICGVAQVLMGLTRQAVWFQAVPPSLTFSLLSGIGILIITSQLSVGLGLESHGEPIQDVSLAVRSLFALEPKVILYEGLVVIMISLGVYFAWYHLARGKFKMVPSSVVAIVSGTLVSFMIEERLPHVGDVWANFSPKLYHESFASVDVFNTKFLTYLVALFAIASLEGLLSANATDRLKEGHQSNLNREIFAHGIGNIACALLGGLPLTGVVVRTKTSIEMGGQTRLAAIFHGLFLTVAVFAFGWLLAIIPVAALAAILIAAGIKLLHIGDVIELYKSSKAEFTIYLLTIVAIVNTELLEGLFIGLILSVFRLVWIFSHIEINEQSREDGRIDVDLAGAATFLCLPKLQERLKALPKKHEVHLHIGNLTFIDHACAEAFELWQSEYEKRGGQAFIEWDAMLKRKGTGVLKQALTQGNDESENVPATLAIGWDEGGIGGPLT